MRDRLAATSRDSTSSSSPPNRSVPGGPARRSPVDVPRLIVPPPTSPSPSDDSKPLQPAAVARRTGARTSGSSSAAAGCHRDDSPAVPRPRRTVPRSLAGCRRMGCTARWLWWVASRCPGRWARERTRSEVAEQSAHVAAGGGLDRGELCLQVRIDAAGRVWAALVAVLADELGVEGLVVGSMTATACSSTVTACSGSP